LNNPKGGGTVICGRRWKFRDNADGGPEKNAIFKTSSTCLVIPNELSQYITYFFHYCISLLLIIWCAAFNCHFWFLITINLATKSLTTLIRKSAVSKISKFQQAGPDDLNINKDTQTLPPAAIDLNLDELRDYFNEQAWIKLQNLCKFYLIFVSFNN
jgi:hypothetical protein